MRKALLAAGVTLGPELLDGPDDRVLEDMAVEYTRLFLGPGKHVPPYESVHARGGGGQLWGAETAIVKRDIEAAGFEYAATFSGLPDHIGIEMEFMAILAAMEAAALKDGDTARALSCLRHQGEFMSRHLAAWAPTFCRRVAEQAMLPFYRQIAELAGAFISTDETEMANRLAVALSPSGDGPQASAGGKTG
ncbi:MAG: molecular chaperone TorD family protein [Rhodospirillales bacterium]|nr:molecular chaperone TorD family protein [Rhodospirillales bacterium]